MDEHGYLMQCNEEEILNTWAALGSLTVNSKTKVYTKGSVIRVDASDGDGSSSAALHNKIIYVTDDYRVDNQTKFCLDWANMTVDDVQGMYAAIQGIQLPFFAVLPAKWTATFMEDNNFIPYQDQSKVTALTAGTCISDLELETILTRIGFPFVVFKDIEYSKSQIIKYMIRPAMQRYFTFRPKIVEEGIGHYSQNSEFLIPFPEGAGGAIIYFTSPGAGGTVNNGLMSPWAMYSETLTSTGGYASTKYGRGITYRNKQVPGYTGTLGGQSISALMDNLAAAQGYVNHFQREHYDRKKIDGKWYAHGFATMGGNLNVKWLYYPLDWDEVKPEDLETIARPMARSEVLTNFAILRGLVKEDIAGRLDPAVLKEERDRIETDLKPIINSISLTGQLAIERGRG